MLIVEGLRAHATAAKSPKHYSVLPADYGTCVKWIDRVNVSCVGG